MLSRAILPITIGQLFFLGNALYLAILSEPFPPHERFVQLHVRSKRRHPVIQQPVLAYQADGGWSARNCSCPQGWDCWPLKMSSKRTWTTSENPRKIITSTSLFYLAVLYVLHSHFFTLQKIKHKFEILLKCCLRVIPLNGLMFQIWVQFRMIFGKVAPAQQNATTALKDTLLHIMVWEIFNPGQELLEFLGGYECG